MEQILTTIKYSIKEQVAKISLNRPEIKNAFNDKMIYELIDVFNELKDKKEVRIIILTGEGDIFCAGADMNWMMKVIDFPYEENYKESLNLSQLFYNIYTCPKPIIGRINGSAFGGGTGLVALCDIAISVDSALFSFSEVKIGLVPACISPYVIKKIGEGKSREYFISGERISAYQAKECNLINYVVPKEELDNKVNYFIKQVLSSGPEAIATCKSLLRKVTELSLEEAKTYTAEVIARLRISEEGQEGMKAFLQKRKPSWLS